MASLINQANQTYVEMTGKNHSFHLPILFSLMQMMVFLNYFINNSVCVCESLATVIVEIIIHVSMDGEKNDSITLSCKSSRLGCRLSITVPRVA